MKVVAYFFIFILAINKFSAQSAEKDHVFISQHETKKYSYACLFPGKSDSLQAYLLKALKEDLYHSFSEGSERVVLSAKLLIDANGKVVDVKWTLKGPLPIKWQFLEKRYLEVLKVMPDWKPAISATTKKPCQSSVNVLFSVYTKRNPNNQY